MKRSIAAVAAALSILLGVAAPVHVAADPDPHMPNPQTGYCPGGRGLKTTPILYCDGVPYADGSHWRYVSFMVSIYALAMTDEERSFYGLHCVMGDELVQSSLAPPGSCDGAV